VLREFLDTFDVGGVRDGCVTEEEFMNYYTNIGASIDNDAYFELMMRNAWHISGGEVRFFNFLRLSHFGCLILRAVNCLLSRHLFSCAFNYLMRLRLSSITLIVSTTLRLPFVSSSVLRLFDYLRAFDSFLKP
jgi:hypothetical protein